jgi:hypothetical protein
MGMIWNIKTLGLLAAVTLSLSAVSAFYAYKRGEQSGITQIQTLWDAERLVVSQAIATELERVRTVETNLRTTLDKQRKEYQYENDRLSVLYQSALSSLSDRPSREDSGSVSEGSNTGTGHSNGCTGAQLYREDAEAALRIARDADKLRLALKACLAHTTEVERQLNKDK